MELDKALKANNCLYGRQLNYEKIYILLRFLRFFFILYINIIKKFHRSLCLLKKFIKIEKFLEETRNILDKLFGIKIIDEFV